MRRIAVLGFLGGMGMMALASDASALVQSTPAVAGRPFLAAEAGCFSSPGFSSRITNTGAIPPNTCPNPGTSKAWLIPIHAVQPAAPESVNHSLWASSAGTGTAPICRFVRRNPQDSGGQTGGPVNVTGTNNFLGNVLVTPAQGDTVHVDCFMAQGGRGMTSVKWLAQ
jgi:hypothetical protein